MAPLPVVHGAIDALAMWTEDRRRRTPAPFRPAPSAPLDCFGPLPDLPAPPDGPGLWRMPSPRTGSPGGDWIEVHVTSGRAPRRGTMVVVPPWKVGSPRLVGGFVRLAVRAGWNAWLAVPPHHAARTMDGTRSGEGFFSPDLGRIRAAFEQLVLELRVLLAAAARAGGETGILGLSLGALGAGLAATGPERLDLAVLVAPPDLALSVAQTPIGQRYRRLAERAGTPIPAGIESLFEPFRPGARRPGARRIFVAAGTFDRVVPPAGPIGLAKAWAVEPRLYPRGHMTLLFACGALRRDLARFLAAP